MRLHVYFTPPSDNPEVTFEIRLEDGTLRPYRIDHFVGNKESRIPGSFGDLDTIRTWFAKLTDAYRVLGFDAEYEE